MPIAMVPWSRWRWACDPQAFADKGVTLHTFVLSILLPIVLAGGAVQVARRQVGPGNLTWIAAVRHGWSVLTGASTPSLSVLQQRCLRRLLSRVSVGVHGEPVVPSEFTIALSQSDLALVEPVRSWFSEGLVAALRDRAEERGWALPARLHVDVVGSATTPNGAPKVTARFGRPATTPTFVRTTDISEEEPLATLPDGGLVLTSANGCWLLEGTTTIGRSVTMDIRVDDPRASRRHCVITCDRGAVTIEDHSKNGTRVNGRRVAAPAALAAGDTIEVAKVRFTVDTRPGPLQARTASSPTRRTR